MPEISSFAVTSSPDSSGFPGEIEAAMGQLQSECAAMIEALCGSSPRAKDVSDHFEIHAKLGWQIWNVAYAPPLTAYRFLPNDQGLGVWLQAAGNKGAPSELLDGFSAAIDRFRAVIETHAEDREMFEMLVDARSGRSNEESILRWRKQAFTGNSFTFGARAKCLVASAILFPASKAHTFSIVRIHGLIGLVRTRAGVRWPLATLVVQQSDGRWTTPGREPLFSSPKVDEIGVPLLADYCSRPLPPVERTLEGDTLHDELLPGVVGLTGANTVFTGEILHEVGPTHGMKEGEIAHFGSGIRTPAELMICDHIVHQSIFPSVMRELRVYSELVSPVSRDDRDRLDMTEELQHLGTGLHRVRTADVPNYSDLLHEAFAKIGFDPNEFEVYRVRLLYPPIPASVMVRHPLPSPPSP